MRLFVCFMSAVALGAIASAAVAQTAPAPSPPDGTYTYAVTRGGAAAGSSAVVIAHAAGTLTVRERASLGPQTLASEAAFDAATLRERSYRLEAGGQTISAGVDGPLATLAADGATLPMTAPSGTSILVCDGLPGFFAVVPAYLASLGTDPFSIATTLSPHAVTVAVAQASSTRPAGVPATDRGTALSFDGGTATVWYDPTTLIVDAADLPAASLAYRLRTRSASVALR